VCVILGTGARSDDSSTVYLRLEVAIRRGAGAETETRSSAEVYAPYGDWRLERPEPWSELPWAD
jgi:hypothetical protein